jgi:sterol desaturase/sphingolipid hydroxylase (fatty acid hydroxylase superfamily)
MNLDTIPLPRYVFDGIVYLASNLTKAVTALIQRDSILYWPYALTGLAIALAVAYASARAGGSFAKSLRAGCSRELWWNASARADYRLYLVNALVVPVLFAWVLFSDKHVVGWLNAFAGGAAASSSADASIVSRVAFTLIFFIAYDFGRFVAHALLHDVAVLWEFHKVHHSAETLNPLTAFRAHPLDLAMMAAVPALTTGVATWAFNRVAEVPVSAYSFLGLHVLVFAFNLVGILRHSQVWLHFGPVWGKWLISPAHHQLHHSCEPEHIGVNRGFELAVWDRLYGTLHVPGRRTPFRIGLGDGTDGEWHNVRRMYLVPFRNAGRQIVTGAQTFARGRRLRPEGEAPALSPELPKPPRG